MYLCGRGVVYLQSMCIKARHVHVAKLCQTSTTVLSHSRSQKDKWRLYGIRYFSDQRTDSSPLSHTASRITEQQTPEHGLVPVLISELHEVSSAPGPVPAEQTSIGMYSSSFTMSLLCFIFFTVIHRSSITGEVNNIV